MVRFFFSKPMTLQEVNMLLCINILIYSTVSSRLSPQMADRAKSEYQHAFAPRLLDIKPLYFWHMWCESCVAISSPASMPLLSLASLNG